MTRTEKVRREFSKYLTLVSMKDWDYADFCLYVGMTNSAVNNAFSRLGIGWKRTIRQRRVLEAVKCIQRGFTLEEVCKDIGYSHASNLGRAMQAEGFSARDIAENGVKHSGYMKTLSMREIHQGNRIEEARNGRY